MKYKNFLQDTEWATLSNGYRYTTAKTYYRDNNLLPRFSFVAPAGTVSIRIVLRSYTKNEAVGIVEGGPFGRLSKARNAQATFEWSGDPLSHDQEIDVIDRTYSKVSQTVQMYAMPREQQPEPAPEPAPEPTPDPEPDPDPGPSDAEQIINRIHQLLDELEDKL